MRYVLIVVGVIVVLIACVVIVGWSLPVRHRVSRSIVLRATPEEVHALLADVTDYPAWRDGIGSVESVAATGGSGSKFREHGKDGAILYEVMRDDPRLRVTRIADPELPFGGQWTYELLPEPNGTRLRITEDGEVYNPVFRFVSRFVMGHARTIEQFLQDVTRRYPAVGAIGS
jgi:hypothetical protein